LLLFIKDGTNKTWRKGSLNNSNKNGTYIQELLQSAATCSRCFLARGFFNPEDGGDMFLRNVGSYKIYTAPHPRRLHSS
jgi:hypothetical protein